MTADNRPKAGLPESREARAISDVDGLVERLRKHANLIDTMSGWNSDAQLLTEAADLILSLQRDSDRRVEEAFVHANTRPERLG